MTKNFSVMIDSNFLIKFNQSLGISETTIPTEEAMESIVEDISEKIKNNEKCIFIEWGHFVLEWLDFVDWWLITFRNM